MLLYVLYVLILYSVGFDSFLQNNFALFLADVSRPGVYHGSLFINLDLGFMSRSGKHLSKILRYIRKKLLYDSSGQVLSRTSLKSAWSSFVLNEVMLLAENNLF